MAIYGYAGKILYVDLSSRKIRKETLSEELIKDYIGSLGINSKLAYDLIEPGVDPLSPKNCIILLPILCISPFSHSNISIITGV